MGIFFCVAKISNIFLGVLEISDMFFGGWRVDAGPEPTYEEKLRVPTLGAVQHGTKNTEDTVVVTQKYRR